MEKSINASTVKIVFSEHIRLLWDNKTMYSLMVFIVWSTSLLHYTRGFLYHLPFITDVIDEVMVAVYVISVLLALPALVNRFSIADYLFYLFCATFVLSGYAFFPRNAEFLDENVLICLFCVFPFYFLGRSMDFDRYFNALVLLSAACILIELFYYLVYAPDNSVVNEAQRNDNMYAAYRLLPHVGLLLWATLEKFRVWKALVLFLGLVFLLACGTRGTFVCLGFFGIIYFFFYMNFQGAIFIKVGIIALVALVIATLQDTLFFLVKTFTDFKLSTRIIEKFLEGDLGNDSHRSMLRDKLYAVMDSGDHFWGLGAFGCRNYYSIIYPHFMPLDFFCSFGYFLGSVLLILLFGLISFSLWCAKEKRSQVLIIFLFSISIIKLMLSNTFLLEPFFYMLIGVCIKEVFAYYSTVHRQLQPLAA